jgi:hypothetical protein
MSDPHSDCGARIALAAPAPPSFQSPPADSTARISSPSAEDLLRLAKGRAMIRARRRFVEDLGEAIQGPPILDMLLSLYVAELERRDLCQSSIESRASRASAHRHSALLVERGMATRAIDPRDQRRKHVRLTSKARQALDRLMDDLSGLS